MRVCDCFFEVTIYRLSEDLLYDKFLWICPLFLDEKKIRVCCSLFEYYTFTTSTKNIFAMHAGRQTDLNVFTTVTLYNKREIVKVCYGCIYF